MAAVDRRVPNLDDFVGLNWGCWVDRVDSEPPDAQSEDTKSGRDSCETMTLRKEDMPIYGHCPAHDDFYLVVCSHCGKLVKPQAFEEHCNRRHSSLTKTSVPSSSTPVQLPRVSRPSSNLPKERQKDSRVKETSVPSFSSQRRTNKPQKETVSLPTVAKVTQDKSHSASPQRPRSQPPPSASSIPNHCRPSSASSSSVSISLSPLKTPVQKPTAAQTSSSPQRETRTYSRTQRNTKASITNKKCEDQDKKKLSVQTKAKTESALPTVASPARHSEPSPTKTKATESQGAPKEAPASRCSKLTLNTNSHIVRSKDVSKTFPEEEESTVEVEVQPPYPFNQSLPPSDDSDTEECSDLSTTSWHPRPLGLCTFGCRAFGCSVFTFDRRLHHLRIALSAMLDDHVNSHLWKKIPQPASNLRSAHPIPSTRGSPIRPRTGPNQTSQLGAKSTSLDRLKNTQNNCKRTKSPPSVQTLSTAMGQQCTSVGQAHMGQRDFMQKAKTAQKNIPLSHITSSKNIAPSNVHVSGSLSKKTPPLSPLRPSERNASLLNEPLPPKPCPPHHKGRRPGLVQSRVGSCDDRALVQKRKSQSTPSPSSSSPSKKCPRLSPPSRSSLFSWKRDSSQDVWLGVWRKEHTAEDDTPGQY